MKRSRIIELQGEFSSGQINLVRELSDLLDKFGSAGLVLGHDDGDLVVGVAENAVDGSGRSEEETFVLPVDSSGVFVGVVSVAEEEEGE